MTYIVLKAPLNSNQPTCVYTSNQSSLTACSQGYDSLNNDMTAAAADCNAPDWSVLFYIVPHEKSSHVMHAAFYRNSLTTCYFA